MSGAAVLCHCGICRPSYIIYGPCCDEPGTEYWAIDYSAGQGILIDGVCYTPVRTTDDIDGISELPAGDPCECDCPPPPPYYILGRCCGGGTEYWTSEHPGGFILIGEDCYGVRRVETDPAAIVGMAHLSAGGACTCLTVTGVNNTGQCAGSHVCTDCALAVVGFEVFGPGEFYEWGHILFDADVNGGVGSGCPAPGDPPWHPGSGWRCIGDQVQVISRWALNVNTLKSCPRILEGYGPELNYDLGEFTWGGDPSC